MLIASREEVAKLSEKYTSLENDNVKLRSELNDLQQYSRRNNVEIKGIPEVEGENLLGLVTKIGMRLDVRIDPADVDICHRTGKKQEGHGTRPIIAKFWKKGATELMRWRFVR